MGSLLLGVLTLSVLAQLNSKIPADGLFPELTIADVMDTTGEYLCYIYE